MNSNAAKNKKKNIDVYKLTFLAIMTAIVIILQLAGSFIRLGMFSISLVLIPVVIGAAAAGPLGGLWLGMVFGLAVLISGDAATFLALSIPGTIITVILKGMLCGLSAGLVYKLLKNTNQYVAVMISSAVCPIVNTAVFLFGSAIFFLPSISEWASAEGVNVFYYMIVFLVGGNFIFEFLVNILLCPVIVRLLKLIPTKSHRYFG